MSRASQFSSTNLMFGLSLGRTSLLKLSSSRRNSSLPHSTEPIIIRVLWRPASKSS
uniref:Uncharacterized protein n=1 Tax=Rhizophora mucronata TaxID=61149 RepID=A0A2P2JFS4_RHIMU